MRARSCGLVTDYRSRKEFHASCVLYFSLTSISVDRVRTAFAIANVGTVSRLIRINPTTPISGGSPAVGRAD